ncbi:hypothetical protein GYMLUDRAFT_242803 [Collybiopsis luxurians FD-317 M1]|uniref:Uncharacterized protein n=1 Tax=Collybiopsis luxurians FD-317 M1 TaxID=944289 RepID=A0A0D0CZR0_9AGAR|nr:hypothetical protein GYMLUDRAFT_242803 [Collybiopsis luxurians FD-317 M1]
MTFQQLQNRFTAADGDHLKFPAPFDTPGVRRQATEVEAVQVLISDQSQYQLSGDTSLDDVFKAYNEEEDRDFDSLKNQKLTEGDAQTVYSTPMKRDRGSLQSSKAWLLGWLIYVRMFYCHISHTAPHAHLLLQIAHILIPNAMVTNNPLFTVYEWILGMDYLTLCKHSRLFLMPLLNSIYCGLDDYLFIILPSRELLERMFLYFNNLHTRRTTSGETQFEDMWASLRNGKLFGFPDDFRDGTIYPLLLVPHPFAHIDVRENLAYPGHFYSHTSPFACLMHAFRTLHIWSTPATAPRGYNEPNENFDRSKLLATALRALLDDEEEIAQTVSAVNMVYQVIQSLLSRLDKEGSVWLNAKKSPRDDSGSSARRGRDRNADSKGHGGAKGLDPNHLRSCIEKNGLSGLEFTGSKSASNDLMCEPYDGMSFFLHNVALGSVRSDASWEGGTVINEPDLHPSSEGPSPAQQIASHWRQAQFHSLPPLLSLHSIKTQSSRTIVGSHKTLNKVYRAALDIRSPRSLLKGVDARIRMEAFRVLAKFNMVS